MRKSLLLAGAAAIAVVAQAQADTYIPVPPVPGSISVIAFGINDSNVIAGSYRDSAGVEHGFFGPLDGSNYTSFDFGGSSIGTEARAIANDGGINGIAFGSGFTIGEEFFRTTSGKFKVYLIDGTPMDGVAQGFNSSDLSMGDYFAPAGGTDRFGYYGKRGKYRKDFVLHVQAPVPPPCCKGKDNPRGINDGTGPVAGMADGSVAGYFTDVNGVEHGFIQTGRKVQVIDFPDGNAILTVLEGINNAGTVAGQWDDATGAPHAFVRDAAGMFTTLDPGDGSSFQQAWGINNSGLTAISTSNSNSFIYCPGIQCGPRGRVSSSIAGKYAGRGWTARNLPPASTITKKGAIQ